jgi:hypothetical protein
MDNPPPSPPPSSSSTPTSPQPSSILSNQQQQQPLTFGSLFSSLRTKAEASAKEVATKIRADLEKNSKNFEKSLVENSFFKKHVAYNVEDEFDGIIPTNTKDNITHLSSSGDSGNSNHSILSNNNNNSDIIKESLTEISNNNSIIGYVQVQVLKFAELSPGLRPFIKVAIEGIEKRGPSLTDKGKINGSWPLESNTFDLPVTDASAEIRIQLWASNVVANDRCLGQVIIPIMRMFPQPSLHHRGRDRDNGDGDNSEMIQEQGWYQIFPLSPNRISFQPGLRDVGKTAMSRPNSPLGYLKIHATFIPASTTITTPDSLEITHLVLKKLDWPTELLTRSSKYVLPKQKKPLPTATDVARTIRHVKRQTKRVHSALHDLSPFVVEVGKFAPLDAILYARTWHDVNFTIPFIFYCIGCIMIVPSWLSPLVLWSVVLLGSWTQYQIFHQQQQQQQINGNNNSNINYIHHPLSPSSIIIWNDQIHDPDENLNHLQLVGKLLWNLEKLSDGLSSLADGLEKLLNIGSFIADKRLAMVYFILTFVPTFLLCGYLWIFGFRSFFIILFIGIILPNEFWIVSEKTPKIIQHMIEWQHTFIIVPILNLIDRIPTREDFGSRVIAEKQRVMDEDLLILLEHGSSNQDEHNSLKKSETTLTPTEVIENDSVIPPPMVIGNLPSLRSSSSTTNTGKNNNSLNVETTTTINSS